MKFVRLEKEKLTQLLKFFIIDSGFYISSLSEMFYIKL